MFIDYFYAVKLRKLEIKSGAKAGIVDAAVERLKFLRGFDYEKCYKHLKEISKIKCPIERVRQGAQIFGVDWRKIEPIIFCI